MVKSLAGELQDQRLQVRNNGPKVATVALTGQPNVGKSTVFNRLTGLNQHVGNWPGKTVEQKSGLFVGDGYEYQLIDLPGSYSLTANSEEERIARDFIIKQRPDVVVAVVDAAIMERSLYLLSELLLLPAPVILVLNMMDVAEQEGIQIEPDVLAVALGIPVVPMSAVHNCGYQELLAAIAQLLEGEFDYHPRRPTILPEHQTVLADVITLVADYVPAPYTKDWIALKLLEGDNEVAALMESLVPVESWSKVQNILLEHEDAILDIAGARYEWIARMVRAAVVQPKVGQVGLTARLDKVLTHPVAGTVVLLLVLGFVFWLTYAIGSPVQQWLDSLLGSLAEFVRVSLSAPAWLVDLLADGVIGGAGMVLTFLPILVFFFAVLGFLEDTGYMARIAYLTDRFMHMMGLHGKSFIPLLLGFGCNVPSILGTRIIETRRARLLTILLAPLVPCTARMAVVTVLSAIFFGDSAGLVAWSLVALNLVVLALTGILFHRLVLKGEQAAFIMELPLYHLPNLRTIGLYVWQNIIAFVEKAGTVILLASIVIWCLSYFPTGDITGSYLAVVGQWLEPVGAWMGLPWPFMVALLTSFVAKENTIATLGILYGDIQTALPEVLTPAAALGMLVSQMLFIPCIAALATIKQEAGWKWMSVSVLMLLVLSLGAGVLIYQVGSLIL
ncbi:MAG: ferrous iron transport protein B [Anaerolineae bacterium]|nr:ferrous iron transport protein B [Anaerolineae bacterium]